LNQKKESFKFKQARSLIAEFKLGESKEQQKNKSQAE
jgi:hypothetical protein